MFGPQARAAELQAVRSAAMRQRIHEVGEEVPEPAPVSLTDFARAQPVSRNKGIKQYKPLTLEDMEDLPPVARVPTQTPSQNLNSQPSLRIRQDAGISNFQDHAPPTAPKAMLETSSALISRNRQYHTPQTRVPISRDYSDSPSWLATLAHQQQTRSPNSPAALQPPFQEQLSSTDFVFGLDSYSPAKPELQLEHLRSFRPLDPAMSSTPISPQSDEYRQMLQNNSHPYPQYGSHDMAAATSARHEPGPFRFHPPGYFGFDAPYLRPHFERSSTFANDVLHHENKLQETKEDGAQTFETAYDRNTKMQSFVAAQQAMAKTGKTVLHNPQHPTMTTSGTNHDIFSSSHSQPANILGQPAGYHTNNVFDKFSQGPVEMHERGPYDSSTASSPGRDPVSSGFTPKPRHVALDQSVDTGTGSSPSRVYLSAYRRKPAECPAIWRALQRRDDPKSHLISPSSAEKVRPMVANEPMTHRQVQNSNVPFPIDEDTGSEEWCTLRQLGTKDREKMRDVRAALSKDVMYSTHGNGVGQTFVNEGPPGYGRNQASGEVALRQSREAGVANITQIARSHLEDPNVIQGGIGRDNADYMTSLRSNVRQHSGQISDTQHVANRTNPQEHLAATPTPLNATRHIMVSHSLVSPPARLARDPRYRPLSAQTMAQHGSLQLR